MSVKRVRSRRLRNGNVGVTVELSVPDWCTLATAAAHFSQFGVSDYLAGIVNMAIIEAEVRLAEAAHMDDDKYKGSGGKANDDDNDDAGPLGDGIPF